MAHILASMFFGTVMFSTVALIAFMLMDAKGSILLALGVEAKPTAVTPRRPVRVRSAGRWQSAARPALAYRSREAA